MQRIPMSLMLAGAALLLATSAGADSFSTRLSGAEEVPPFETEAKGKVVFKAERGRIKFTLMVDAANVLAAHIHCAPAGVNGPVGVLLFAGTPTTVTGILASGTIAAPAPGNACGWADVDDIVAAIASGDTYVNVHTLQSPPGEIRGQLD